MKNRSKILILVVALCMLVLGPISAQDADKMYTIGLLSFGNDAFVAEMEALGYVEGQNVTYVNLVFGDFATTTPEEAIESYRKQAQAMADLPVDVFVTNNDTEAVNLKSISGDIPVVFTLSDDPVATGAVKDLTNPGGVITGSITNKHHERRLQLLTEVKPSTKKVFYLYSPLTLEAEVVLGQVKAVAADLDVEVIPAPITDGPSGVEALKNAPKDLDWLFLTPFVPFDVAFYQELSYVSTEYKVGIAAFSDTPIPGYVIGYGPNIDESRRQAAQIVDRILRGASPADLPVQTAENFLMVNLEAAEVIDLEIPVGILRQATTIIRPGYFEENPPFGAPAPAATAEAES